MTDDHPIVGDTGAEIPSAPVVVTQENYADVLARVRALAALDPAGDSPEGRELLALALPLKEFEKTHFTLRYGGFHS